MSKYSDDELKTMAKILQEAERCADERYLRFIMKVSLSTRTSPQYVMQKINEYANR